MTRLLFSTLLTLAAAPAIAASGAAENCAATAAIVADAVAERTGGAGQQDAIATLTAGDIDDRYAPAVQPLVEWVYTLPQEQLTEDAPAAFEAACLEQAG